MLSPALLHPICTNQHLKQLNATLKMMKPDWTTWNRFALFAVVLPVILLTLNPFDFQAFTAAEFWVWRFSVEDFSRNVLLLFPLGLMLGHCYRLPHRFSILAGLLLSACVEVGQLFIVDRTSNVVDLISNSSGAWLGSIVYRGVFQSRVVSLTLPFLFMLMPLCWAIAIVTSFRSEFVWAILPCMLAALLLFQDVALPPVKKQLARGIWIVAAILPLINADLVIGGAVLASVPFVLYTISKVAVSNVDRSRLHPSVVILLCTSTSILLLLTYRWYLSIEDWVWISSRHLSWITLLLSVMATGSSLAWYRTEQS